MSLQDRVARHLPHRIVAASPFGGTASDGAAIVEFTPNVVQTIRLGARGAAYDALYRTTPASR